MLFLFFAFRIKSVFGESMRSPTKEDLNKLDYLERVLKETMRLYTVVPIIARKTQKELKLCEYNYNNSSITVSGVLSRNIICRNVYTS